MSTAFRDGVEFSEIEYEMHNIPEDTDVEIPDLNALIVTSEDGNNQELLIDQTTQPEQIIVETEKTAKLAGSVISEAQKNSKPKTINGKSNSKKVSSNSNEADVDTIRTYLSDIGKVPLLTKDDEIELAIAILNGEKAKLGLNNPDTILNSREKRKFRLIIREGEAAKDRFINSNLRLVVSLAKRYQGRGLELQDLIQEGNLGMMHAVDKFDHTKGFKFSTYATWWIRQAVTRAIADKGRTIRVPVHADENIKNIQKKRFSYIEEFGMEPTLDELSLATGLPLEKIIDLINIDRSMMSFEDPIGEDRYLGDVIADPRSIEDFDNTIRENSMNEELEKLMSGLNEREREVIKTRWGIGDREPKTLEETGKDFGVTRERIRQIEAKALAKMRHPHMSGDSTVVQD